MKDIDTTMCEFLVTLNKFSNDNVHITFILLKNAKLNENRRMRHLGSPRETSRDLSVHDTKRTNTVKGRRHNCSTSLDQRQLLVEPW